MIVINQALKTLEDRIAEAKLLLSGNSPLTQEGTELVYKVIFAKRPLTDWDRLLQSNEKMPESAVSEEIGQDLVGTYGLLVDKHKLNHTGRRVHNFFPGLPRHLWDTAFRAYLMGLDTETRMLALAHSIPEHNARGVQEARGMITNLKEDFGNPLGKDLGTIAYWDGILIDHLSHRVKKIGRVAKLNERVEELSDGPQRTRVKSRIEEVSKLSGDSNKRLIPKELAGNDLIYPEVRARLHPDYIAELAATCRRNIEQAHHNGRAYNCAPMIVKALCFIDRLRTADGMAPVEKVTREALDFATRLDKTAKLLQRSGIVNNPLTFVNAALKTELLTELDQRAAEVNGRRDSTFAGFGRLLETRLGLAKDEYGNAAMQMGYIPRYRIMNRR